MNHGLSMAMCSQSWIKVFKKQEDRLSHDYFLQTGNIKKV